MLDSHVDFFGDVLDSHEHLFEVEPELYVHLFGDVLEPHENSFGAFLNSTYAY